MLVYLTGFMCSGKTTTGKAVAEILKVPFLDLDEELEKRSGRSVSDFINSLGIDEFRRLESVILFETHQLLRQDLVIANQSVRKPDVIIATGGGCVLLPENRAYLAQAEHAVCWLNTSFELLTRRFKTNPRPLLNDLSDTAINEMYLERLPYYQSTATHITTSTDQVEEILAWLSPQKILKQWFG